MSYNLSQLIGLIIQDG